MAAFLAGLVFLGLVLVLTPCRSQSTQTQSERWIHDARSARAALPPPAARVWEQGPGAEDHHVSAQHITKVNENLGIFIAAAMVMVTVMGVVYCIYTKFYSRHRYLHTPLYDDTDLTLDLPELAPIRFHGSALGMKSCRREGGGEEVWRSGDAPLSDTPSVIAVPPCLSPPPPLLPYPPPLFLSSQRFRTISASDLARGLV